MEIKQAIDYLRPIADSAHLKQYSAALDTAIRSMEEVEALRKELRAERDRFDRLTDFELSEARELERVKRERYALKNELCLWCNHRMKYPDACDHCRWKE